MGDSMDDGYVIDDDGIKHKTLDDKDVYKYDVPNDKIYIYTVIKGEQIIMPHEIQIWVSNTVMVVIEGGTPFKRYVVDKE